MKYIIDVEKIKGTNLYKAKEFNTLVFDKNGLMRMMTLEDELGDYYKTLREEIYKKEKEITELQRKLFNERVNREWYEGLSINHERRLNELKDKLLDSKTKPEVIDFLRGENEMLRNKIEALRKDNKVLKEYNDHLEEKSDKISKLANEKAELLEKINSIDNKLLEKSVPIEEVVEYASLEETIDKKTHSTREYQRLFNTVKSQKGMLKKQGKDISRLQKETKELKQRCKFEEVERLRESIEKLVTENENLKTELKKFDPFE